MILSKPKFTVAALAAMLLAAAPLPASAEHGPHAIGALFRLFGIIRGETREIDREAMANFEAAPRTGSCEERRTEFLKMLPEALRFARYARDIYERDHEAKMKAEGLKTLDLGDGHTAYYQAAGRRYAEVHVDAERHEVVVVFRGTRLSVGSDVSTDVLSFIGLETGYYDWTSSLVARMVREHPGMSVVATGQSLGGGLTIYAVLHNPGVKGYAFNPAGLSLLAWGTTSRAERDRVNDALTVISTRNALHIEPVTAISLAGRSVLPGHIFVLETGALNPLTLHSAKTVAAALEHSASADAEREVCDGDLGVLAE